MLAVRSPEEESPETEEMDTSEPNWCWFYLAECGVWHMFEVSFTQAAQHDTLDQSSSHTCNPSTHTFQCWCPFAIKLCSSKMKFDKFIDSAVISFESKT